MLSLIVTTMQFFACLGFGSLVLTILRLPGSRTVECQLALSFAVGFGTFGWILFFLGIAGAFNQAAFWFLLTIGCLCIVFFQIRQLDKFHSKFRPQLLDYLIFLILIVVLFFDILEAITPPIDGDTLAYHFDLAKRFMIAGEIVFVPRAMDGAIPLLVQLTYVPVLSLGGELSLTLWTMLSAWLVAFLLYTLCHHFMDFRWSVMVAVLFLTTPAIVFSGGSGHAETRMALFVLLAAFALSKTRDTDLFRYTVLAGLATGFVLGSKYTGPLFAVACGLTLTFLMLFDRKKWFVHGSVFTVTSILIGSQWYAWNWLHTGDPVFPILFNWLGSDNPLIWNAEHHLLLQNYIASAERSVPKSIFWLIAYPFVATFNGLRGFESGRIGLGPYLMLLMPFFVAGVYFYRDKIRTSPLLPLALIAFLFYVLWFWAGNSQRIRHLVPIYPLALLCVTAVSQRWAQQYHVKRPILIAGLGGILVQVSGQGVFSVKYMEYAFNDQTREEFLASRVAGFEAVDWINHNLTEKDRVYSALRHINYLMDKPIYYAHFLQEALIDIRPAAYNLDRYAKQLRAQNISHLLVHNTTPDKIMTGWRQWRPLLERGCLEEVRRFKFVQRDSRTLPMANPKKTSLRLLRTKLDNCPTEKLVPVHLRRDRKNVAQSK